MYLSFISTVILLRLNNSKWKVSLCFSVTSLLLSLSLSHMLAHMSGHRYILYVSTYISTCMYIHVYLYNIYIGKNTAAVSCIKDNVIWNLPFFPKSINFFLIFIHTFSDLDFFGFVLGFFGKHVQPSVFCCLILSSGEASLFLDGSPHWRKVILHPQCHSFQIRSTWMTSLHGLIIMVYSRLK